MDGTPARPLKVALDRRRSARRLGPLLVLLALGAWGGSAWAADEEPVSSEPAALGEAPVLSVGPLQYRPGRGLRFGDTGLVLGGFTTVKVETTQASGAEFSLDLLNFFLIFDRIPRFRAVAELQLKDTFVATGQASGAFDFAFDVRRLFGDFTVTDALRVRAGTFLTPVGYWNLILAPPLTWTTEAPVIVEETFFQQTTTGVMLHGSTGLASGRFGYELFSQFLDPLADDPDLDPPAYTAGVRLTYDTGLPATFGGSFQAAENRSGAWSQLGAAHLLWQPRYGEVLSELYVQGGDALPSTQWGTYLQGVLTVREPFYLVGRYEYFDPPAPEPTLNLFTIGAVAKPFPFMALKVEYRFVDRNVPDPSPGFFASFTTFF